MAEQTVVEAKPAVPVIETKPAATPAPVASAPVDKAAPVEVKPVTEVKNEVKAEVKPAEELKSLLDEAGEEPKLDAQGKPIAEAEVKAVPDKYNFKLPEGMTLDEAKIALVEPLFKKLGLDNEGAQELVDLQLQLQKANEEQHVQAWEAFCEGQKAEAKAYFGTKLPEVMRNVARARDTFISKPLQEKLNTAGFSNDKDFLEALDKVGRVIGEGKFVEGKRSAPGRGTAGVQTPTGKEPTLADIYPSMVVKT